MKKIKEWNQLLEYLAILIKHKSKFKNRKNTKEILDSRSTKITRSDKNN